MMKLKKCPFCGHTATFREYEHRRFFDTKVFYYAECFGCGTRTEMCVDAIIAAAKWNRRVDDDDRAEDQRGTNGG